MKIGMKLPSLLEQCSDNPKPTMTVDYRSVPANWGGRIGEISANQLRTGWTAIQPAFEFKLGKMTPEEFKERLNETLQECTDYHAYVNFYYGYVQVEKA